MYETRLLGAFAVATLFILFPNNARADGVAADEKPLGDLLVEPFYIFWEQCVLAPLYTLYYLIPFVTGEFSIYSAWASWQLSVFILGYVL